MCIIFLNWDDCVVPVHIKLGLPPWMRSSLSGKMKGHRCCTSRQYWPQGIRFLQCFWEVWKYWEHSQGLYTIWERRQRGEGRGMERGGQAGGYWWVREDDIGSYTRSHDHSLPVQLLTLRGPGRVPGHPNVHSLMDLTVAGKSPLCQPKGNTAKPPLERSRGSMWSPVFKCADCGLRTAWVESNASINK